MEEKSKYSHRLESTRLSNTVWVWWLTTRLHPLLPECFALKQDMGSETSDTHKYNKQLCHSSHQPMAQWWQWVTKMSDSNSHTTDCSKRLPYIQSLWKLQILYSFTAFKGLILIIFSSMTIETTLLYDRLFTKTYPVIWKFFTISGLCIHIWNSFPPMPMYYNAIKYRI
jgi:hypothetical protein